MAIYVKALKQEVRDLLKFQEKEYNPDGDSIVSNQELSALLSHYETDDVHNLMDKPSLKNKVMPSVIAVEESEDGNYIVEYSNGKSKKLTEKELTNYAAENAPSYLGGALKGTFAFVGICLMTNGATRGLKALGTVLAGLCGGSFVHNIRESHKGDNMVELAKQIK